MFPYIYICIYHKLISSKFLYILFNFSCIFRILSEKLLFLLIFWKEICSAAVSALLRIKKTINNIFSISNLSSDGSIIFFFTLCWRLGGHVWIGFFFNVYSSFNRATFVRRLVNIDWMHESVLYVLFRRIPLIIAFYLYDRTINYFYDWLISNSHRNVSKILRQLAKPINLDFGM